MLDSLRFVQGAIKKDAPAALTHFKIANGRITGCNGQLVLSAPIPLDIEALPKADKFIAAISACKEETAISLTKTGRLSIKSGAFQALIECTTEQYPDTSPIGEFVKPEGGFIHALKTLQPFIGTDPNPARAWSNGILLKGKSAFATNNIILVEYWLGYEFPCAVNLPAAAVKELVRIKEEPQQLQVARNELTCHFSGNRRLQTLLLDTQWPELSGILDKPHAAKPLPPGFYNALNSVAELSSDNKIHINRTGISTGTDDTSGAHVSMPIACEHYFECHAKFLQMLEGVADTFDFGNHNKAALWFAAGKPIRGAILGMRG
jgi:hypothetical protein